MKKQLVFAGIIFAVVALVASCQKEDNAPVSDFTGNQTTYSLQAASAYPISGNVILKERKDGATTIAIALTGVTDNNQHPVHLHLGDMATDKASIAALLAPVAGKDGQSETIIKMLADETPVAYADLVKLSACVKIHLGSSGAEADVILVAGNIGSAASSLSGGRAAIAVCSSK